MKRITALLSIGSALCVAYASAMEFDLNDPKGVNSIAFSLDAPLESIAGTASGISGSLKFDPAKPEETSGKLVLAVDSMSVPNPEMQDHLLGARWMDAKKHPEIVFELASLSDVEQEGNKTEGTAHGTMTIKGVSKDIMVPISFTFLEGKLAARQRVEGDLVVVRSSFSVNRSDFDVNAGQSEDKVADEVVLSLSLAGSHAH